MKGISRLCVSTLSTELDNISQFKVEGCSYNYPNKCLKEISQNQLISYTESDIYLQAAPDEVVHGELRSYLGPSLDHVVCDEPENYLESSPTYAICDEPESYLESSPSYAICDEPDSYLETSSGHLISDEPESYLESPPNYVACNEPDVCLEPALVYAVCDEPESYDDDVVGENVSPALNGHVPRRKALLIGITYERNEELRGKSLKGPHHDVDEVRKLLQGVYGWDAECLKVLRDDGILPQSQPTLENIRCELKQLVEGAEAGDHLFFYFSGHGGQVPDLDGDEDDEMDEVLFTCDGKMLVDDELHETIVEPLPAGCRLTALLDCCSSGTGLDLPFNAVSPKQSTFQNRTFMRRHSDGDVVLLAACEDSKRAWEKRVGGERRVMGMLTQAFIKSLKTRRRSTYSDLLSSVRTQLHRRQTMQNPQLSSTHAINMNDFFDL
ncbi:hypothetical protein M0805_008815 [Coniferiporia weirii]|nr:hypothetical protein M0805_008815 [Coniferiporia weirii]